VPGRGTPATPEPGPPWSQGGAHPQEATSVQQAVILLGPRQLHRLATLAIAQGLGVQPEQRLTQIIGYAMLTDLVGVRHAVAAGTGFLAGLVLEVAEDLETPLETLIKDLPLAPDLARALRDRQGTLGSALDVVAAYKWSPPTRRAPPTRRHP
jgi:c-di-GMP-related signal transduction protein